MPLDPDYPAERLALMMDDCDLRLLVVDETARARLAAGSPRRPGAACTPGETEEGEALETGGLDGQALAHVIYTSGSTGRPKGVALAHRAVVRLVRETNYARLGPGDRVAQVSNLSFDAATYEIWGALLNGATLVVIPRDVVLSPPDLAAALSEHRITTMLLTAALFARMAQEEPDAFAGMRELLVGGEAVDPAARAAGARRPAAPAAPQRVRPHGEHDDFHLVSRPHGGAGRRSPSDRRSPIRRSTCWTAGSSRCRSAWWASCAIGGEGLAWGYWRRPELTAERFVPDLAGPAGSRLYRTGDLGRRRADGDPRVPGPHRPPGQDPRLPHRAGRDRGPPRPSTPRCGRPSCSPARTSRATSASSPTWCRTRPARPPESGEQTEQVSQWGEIFDDIYREEAAEADPTFNIIGWNSTYTGLPLPASEMEEWLDDTIGAHRRARSRGGCWRSAAAPA